MPFLRGHPPDRASRHRPYHGGRRFGCGRGGVPVVMEHVEDVAQVLFVLGPSIPWAAQERPFQ